MIEKSMARAIAAALLASSLMAGHTKAFAETAAAEAADARMMESAYIAVPVVRQGLLTNYLFVTVRVDIANGVDLWRTRERAHFLRDSLVRAAHRNDLADPSHDDRLNAPAAITAFTAAAREALGVAAVRSVSVPEVRSSRVSGWAAR